MPANTTAYYEQTAEQYDTMHGGDLNLEHMRALEQAWGILRQLDVRSVLDVGCGTGRSLMWLAERDPSMQLVGVEPSPKMLDLARQNLPDARLSVGEGEKLDFADGSIDLVMASAVMHHVPDPDAVIREMFRVARLGVMVSDHNNFAFGGTMTRRARLLLHTVGLLGAATFIKQGFSKQGYSDDDGWWYPFSLYNHHATFAANSTQQFIFPTKPWRGQGMGNLLTDTGHFAVIALKPQARWTQLSDVNRPAASALGS